MLRNIGFPSHMVMRIKSLRVIMATCFLLIGGLILVIDFRKPFNTGADAPKQKHETAKNSSQKSNFARRLHGDARIIGENKPLDLQDSDAKEIEKKRLADFMKAAELLQLNHLQVCHSALQERFLGIKRVESQKAVVEFAGEGKIVIRIPGLSESDFLDVKNTVEDELRKQFPSADADTLELLQRTAMKKLLLSESDHLILLATMNGELNMSRFTVWWTTTDHPGSVDERGNVRGVGFSLVAPDNPVRRDRFDYLERVLAERAKAGQK